MLAVNWGLLHNRCTFLLADIYLQVHMACRLNIVHHRHYCHNIQLSLSACSSLTSRYHTSYFISHFHHHVNHHHCYLAFCSSPGPVMTSNSLIHYHNYHHHHYHYNQHVNHHCIVLSPVLLFLSRACCARAFTKKLLSLRGPLSTSGWEFCSF